MKSNRVLAPLWSAMVLVGGSSSVYSQELAPAPQLPQALAAQTAPDRKSTDVIRIKNISAKLMAFWLDPANNPQPTAWQAMPHPPGAAPQITVQDILTLAVPKATEGVFKLPAGIDQIVAIDPQNAILVFGTAAGVRELQETIRFLDRPLRQVEIETEWVQISEEDAKAFRIDATSPQAGQVALGYVRGNFQDTLTKLVNAKKAKVVAAPRATVINNFAARLSTNPVFSAAVGFQGEDGQFHQLIDPAAKAVAPLKVGTSFEVEFTPTINNDDTITLLISAKQRIQISSDGQAPFAARTSGGIESIVNVRDGNTILLRGLNSRFLVGTGQDKKAKASHPLILLFVTAHILRRANDEAVAEN